MRSLLLEPGHGANGQDAGYIWSKGVINPQETLGIPPDSCGVKAQGFGMGAPANGDDEVSDLNKESGENGGTVETWPTAPINRSIPRDQCARAAIADKSVVGDRSTRQRVHLFSGTLHPAVTISVIRRPAALVADLGVN